MTACRLDLWEALRLRRRLSAEIVCSGAWLEAIVKPASSEASWEFHTDVYPPGGDETLMQACPACRRISPPVHSQERACCDCQTEHDERAFLKWALRREHRNLLPLLGPLWWRSAISYADFRDRPSAGMLGEACLSGNTSGAGERENQLLPRTTRRSLQGCAFDMDPAKQNEDGNRGGHTPDPRFAVDIALRRLNPPKKGEGIASGCQLVLLSESEEKLRREIAYYHRKRRLIPSARRYSRPNPYVPAAEDYDTPTRVGCDLSPETTGNDAEEAAVWG